MAHENATPRPWAVDGEGIRTMVRGDDLTIVAVRHRNPAENHAANAVLIVEAVNAYDTLRAENERLRAGLRSTLALIDDYLAYRHDGDPWSEDARLMGEMEINYAAKDGRLEAARAALSEDAQ